MTTTRNRPISTDSRGRYKVDVGRKLNESGKLLPHRFLLGTDRVTAERSAARLKQLWAAIEAGHDPTRRVAEVSKAPGRMTVHSYREVLQGPAVWGQLEMAIAAQVARGEQVIRLDREIGDPTEYAAWFNATANRFPFLVFIPGEAASKKLADGTAANEALVEAAIGETVERAKARGRLPARVRRPGHSLHDALNAYAESVEREGVRDEHGHLKASQTARLERLERFKIAHEDRPLDTLNRDAVAEMVAHWRNRPETQKGTRSSRHNVRHHVGELFRFFRWLDGVDRFGWAMPRGLASLPRKVAVFDHERTVSAISKTTFTVEQLATLNAHATPIERLMLYVGLNCAMGAAEAGRIRLDDIALHQPHPHAARLHFETSDDDNYIRYRRPKTLAFGEWRLWAPTAAMVEWGIARARAAGADLLFCYSNGLPIYGRAKNAQQGFRNLWDALLDRVQEYDPAFPRLPYGSLRDTLPDTIRHKYDGELASLCLAHGSPSQADSLLECYANKPFGRLHKATSELFDHFKPVFDAADDPTDKRKKFYSPTMIERMRNDRAAGVPVAKIARELGVSEMTVRRHTASQT